MRKKKKGGKAKGKNVNYGAHGNIDRLEGGREEVRMRGECVNELELVASGSGGKRKSEEGGSEGKEC